MQKSIVKSMKLNILKDQRGQVLLIVMVVGFIALIITMGMVAQVARLGKSNVESESHDVAFSAAETYSQKILEDLDENITVDAAYLAALVNSNEDLIAAKIENLSFLDSLEIENSSAIEFPCPGEGQSIIFDISNWDSGEDLLFTVLSYDGNSYHMEKQIYNDGCGSSLGDIDDNNSISGNSISCSSGTVTYSSKAGDVSLKVKPIGGNIIMDVTSGGVIADKYSLKTQNEDLTFSEVTLTVSKAKTSPTLFDHVLFNGYGTITKSF